MPASERSTVVLTSTAPRAIEWAAERLATGGVIALPTDTVYGVAASLSHPDALARLFEIKGRADDKPIPVLISSTSLIAHLTSEVPSDVALLLDEYWPGPLTAVLPARAGMPAAVTGPGQTIGLRMPNHPLAIEVIDRAGGAVACTSANRSGGRPASTADEVLEALEDQIDLVLDGGLAPGGVASTVVAFSGDRLTILREGPILAAQLQDSWHALIAGRG
jgi:L-threonylcarbamoyladenylate synthase